MKVIGFPILITARLTAQGISHYACLYFRDAGITAQLTARSRRLTYEMKTLLLGANPSRGIIMLLTSDE